MSTPKRILIVDDDEASRRLLKAMVESLGHESEAARDGIEALARLKLGFDLVLLDVRLPGMDGYQVARRIRDDPATADLPIVMVTVLESKEDRLRAVEAGANDFISKPLDKTELRVRSASLLRLKEAQDAVKRHRAELEDMVERRTVALRAALQEMVEAQRRTQRAQLDTVERLAIAAEYKDKITAQHIRRIGEYSAILAAALNLPPGEVELIQHASRMHDVGKIGIPDGILQKPASLNVQEWDIMRKHTLIGSRILADSSSDILRAGQVIALSHHEWWDGTGYPNGLAGDSIPLWARICAVADVFDAVTSRRPYKPAFTNEAAFEILHQERGTHFDPRVVDTFFKRLDDVLTIQTQYRDEAGMIGW
ncbi:MAG: two-component system response regulator [Acidobacteria bacterium RIFCSPLOWO2_02_FULL_67_36]|nr:MAG: two-component system response regulator [Acidobacteria bacterium RIFCSPLOWO2_02_FULL_67_36]OFW18554.1 MAG: two-component system response regulator [Acidobacteria bacterium RIFCSPLOWO2_12_FULL_66_21]